MKVFRFHRELFCNVEKLQMKKKKVNFIKRKEKKTKQKKVKANKWND